MAKQLRYQGEFFSVAGVLWRVEDMAGCGHSLSGSR